MSVSVVGPQPGCYQNNSIKLSGALEPQTPNAEDLQDILPEEPGTREPAAGKEDAGLDTADSQSFDSYDFAQLYRQDETFALKGIDSDINSLDVEKAVGDLDKDQILQQYQYFVGDEALTSAKKGNAPGAMPRSGENFFL